MKLTEKLVKKLVQPGLSEGDRIVDIEMYSVNKHEHAQVIVITKHHFVEQYVIDLYNNKIKIFFGIMYVKYNEIFGEPLEVIEGVYDDIY